MRIRDDFNRTVWSVFGPGMTLFHIETSFFWPSGISALFWNASGARWHKVAIAT
jgi:hypothetical protein